jgi:uncharacterized membrane protein
MMFALMFCVIMLLMYLNHVDGMVRRLDDEPERKGKRWRYGDHDDER